MKKFKPFFKTLLTAVVLMSANFGFAQAVASVPVGCTVVVAGTGGTLGANPTGRVGDGGVVIMPDPSGGGAFNFTIAGTPTTASWALRGDLSTTTVAGTNPLYVGNYNGATQSTTGSSATINTYNKDLRTESTERFNPSWARSKGQVKVSWTAPPCNNSITFDVFKTFTSIPTIVGPTCLEPLKQYTFSIDQIASDNANDNIGFDKYYWSGIPAGITSFYYSADNSSVTFTMGGGAVPALTTLRCCVGRYNTTANADGGNGPNPTGGVTYLTCVTKNLTPLTTAPSYVTLPPTCHPTGTVSFNIVYPNVVLPLTYTWTAPNTGWTINAPVVGAINTTVTVNTPNNNPGLLILTITGSPCGAILPINYQVNRNLTGTTLITPNTTSPGTNCMLVSSSNNQFFLGANASANNVTWTVTSPLVGAAANITLSAVSGQPSSTVAVAIGANAPVNTTYTLRATANTTPFPACNATSATYTFNVRPRTPTITAAIGSSNCVVKGALTAQTYTCTASTGASYNWVFPAGWSPATSTTTINSIIVTPSSTTAVLNGNAFVTATGVGTCNSPQSVAFAINYNPVAPTFTTPNPTLNCFSVGATTASIGITNAQTYGTYSVTSTPAGITSSGVITGGNLALTFPPTLIAGSYTITVNHVAAPCGTATSTTPSITLATSIAAWAINYPSYDPTVGGSDVYRVNTQPALTTYAWYTGPTVFTTIGALTLIPFPGTNPNASFSPSGNQMTLYGATPLTNPQVYCIVTPPGGCPTIISAPKGNKGTARMGAPIASDKGKIIIYPNPNDGNFNIQIEEIKESASATITDMTGKKLGTYNLTKGDNKIKNKNLSSGTYIVVIDIDGKQESQRVIIK